MPPTPGLFESIYASPWHNPGLFWLAAACLVLALASRLPFLLGFLVVFAFEIAADALAGGELSPLKGSPWGTPISIAFVILGDFRFFLLIERRARLASSLAKVALVALGWALIVPASSYVLGLVVPALGSPMRMTFLTYEVEFLVLALALRFFVLPKRLAADDPKARTFLLSLASFEAVQYALWAAADVVILAGYDAGFALRLVPNAMYYALFLPFVLWRAPASLFDRNT